MSQAQRPRVISPPSALPALGPLVIVDGECAYFPAEARESRTAFALPGPLRADEYRRAMGLGMRRSGTLVYRPICPGCRRCQPFRIDVSRFQASRSQRRVQRRCDGLFKVEVVRPRVDDEHLRLYARYQAYQHDKEGQATDEESYARFLVDTVADTWELEWRDEGGALVGVGVIDVVDDGISSVYFFWDPRLEHLSMGVYSALWEIELCARWQKPYYYLGYLVSGSRTMSYKAQFEGGEVWNGRSWLPVESRDLADPKLLATLTAAERSAIDADHDAFPLSDAEPR